MIHPTSVAVSREHRRAKTDRLDTELLMRAFLGWLRGEKRHCSMAAIPTLEEEDAKRPNRERENLVAERTRIVNRMKAILARLGIRSFKPTLRKAAEKLDALRTPEGTPLPPNTLAELRRDMARLRVVREQISEIEHERLRKLAAAPAEERPPCDGSAAGAGRRRRRRDGRHAGPRGPLAPLARSQGRRPLRRPDRLAGRERQTPARARVLRGPATPGSAAA